VRSGSVPSADFDQPPVSTAHLAPAQHCPLPLTFRYTALVAYQVELNEQELKLILAAIRQARHTFAVAQRHGETLADEYGRVDEMYGDLHDRLNRLLEPPSGPIRVK
jgi:hypothetical protein